MTLDSSGFCRKTFDELSSSPGGVIRFLRRDLGITAFGAQVFELRPNQRAAEHRELRSGQEELYVGLDGDGWLELEGAPAPLGPRTAIAVAPHVRRQAVAGPEGLTYLCVGAPPGGPYVPPRSFR